ncbi:uncharacterized protein LOC131841114 [Achroia grisella]|uniref:uncharacterized protein LOC131841114 n=1 Tax=Achroia grisella TaxID=688607 RepID=UPI0027D25153|nr:uncharacterized protein LOC131841114 [Achroia grisella]
MIVLIISALIPAILVLVAFRFVNKRRKPAIFGVYQLKNKNYYFKFVLMYTILRIRQLVTHLKRLLEIELGRSADGIAHVQRQDTILEQQYYLDHAQAIDAVYFNGMSKEGDALICGLARRPGNVCDAFLYLKVEGQELLLSPNLPDTYLKQKPIEEGEYSVEGIELKNFVPMRTWELKYNGEMKPRNDGDKKTKVQMTLTWSAKWAPFNYDKQISPRCLAGSIAREQWSRDYFNLLKRVHQTHYEQMGFAKGTVSIDGKEHVLNIPCVRDHTFGPFRDWRTFHRYVYHFIFLENGDCAAVGNVCQPAVLSNLTIGYYCRDSDQKVFPIDSCDFQIYQHGEDQILPKDYGFVFEAGWQNYAVRVKVDDEETFYIGKEREAKFYERWSTVDINGVKGRACVEWHYNNVQAKKTAKSA